MSIAEREIALPDTAATSEPSRRLFTREEYHRAAEAGVFRPDEKLELIEGEVYCKVSPQNNPHFVAIRATTENLEKAFGPTRDVRYQAPLVLDDLTEPEPDILVLKQTWRHYIARPPHQADVLLVVEVSDSTLKAHRLKKSLMYAKAGIPEYWIVNVQEQSVEVYRDLKDARYETVTTVKEAGTLTPLAALDAIIDLMSLFPAPLVEETQ